MLRTLTECRKAKASFSEEPVHDLRVALRRCRSMADGFTELSSDPQWLEMKRAGRKLFKRLGELRDAQVLLGWTEKLAPNGDGAGKALLDVLHEREAVHKVRAQKALNRFDRTAWKNWAKRLSGLAAKVPLDGLVFQHLALKRWEAGMALHRKALRNRSRTSWHALRIGVKRFRYIVENFLPEKHAAWGTDLKAIQDLLGEVHDLDVLWTTLRQTRVTSSDAEREKWRGIIDRERAVRLAAYRQMMCGRKSKWKEWRAGLPNGAVQAEAAFATLECWAENRDPEFSHTRHITQLALNLYDELAKVRVAGPYATPRHRDWLRAAGLLHNTGRAGGRRGHHKAAYHFIRELDPPIGWTAEEMEMVALIARFHRGAEPATHHVAFAALQNESKEIVIHLSGVLRLAAALDVSHDARVRKLRVESQPELLLIWARGFREGEENAQIVASARHLLERALKRPVLIREFPGAPSRMLPGMNRAVEVA